MSDLSELFDRDPLKISDQDLVIIITRLREYMTQFELGAKPPPKPDKPKVSKKTQDLLKDLGLG